MDKEELMNILRSYGSDNDFPFGSTPINPDAFDHLATFLDKQINRLKALESPDKVTETAKINSGKTMTIIAGIIDKHYLKWLKTDDENFTNFAYQCTELIMEQFSNTSTLVERTDFELKEIANTIGLMMDLDQAVVYLKKAFYPPANEVNCWDTHIANRLCDEILSQPTNVVKQEPSISSETEELFCMRCDQLTIWTKAATTMKCNNCTHVIPIDN